MKFVWAEDKTKNERLEFSADCGEKCDFAVICAVDFYQVFGDEKLISCGPSRTAAGYVCPRTVNIKGVKNLIIKTVSYGVDNFSCDRQKPFFGIEVYKNGKIVLDTDDFVCYKTESRIAEAPRYSIQRGFMEIYDFNKINKIEVRVKETAAPVLLEEREFYSDLNEIKANLTSISRFNGFSEYETLWWEADDENRNLIKDIYRYVKGKTCRLYAFERERTGFIKIKFDSSAAQKIIIAFDEIQINGEIKARRSGCNDFIMIDCVSGENDFISAEPYAFKFLQVISKYPIECDVSCVTYENNRLKPISLKSFDKQTENILEAAKNTFAQNAVDIFTDCPGRERAGWLCDSYFTAKAELFFTGKNDIEKAFLENFLIANTPEIDYRLVPECFPAEHKKDGFIPNWAMWFVIEIYDRVQRIGDLDFANRARNKIYGIVDYFSEYKNEYGLLENLDGWVFIEWSISNDDEYVKGVNYPTNMLYAFMLECAGKLYCDKALLKESETVREEIIRRSFNGQFFVDNSVRGNGELVRCEKHISETCQYYALFTGIVPNKEFESLMLYKFGPLRQNAFPDVGRSNMFIGNYLRFFWLISIGEKQRFLSESIAYFNKMVDLTGTLWEKDSPTASCNHGFASVIAYLVNQAT